MLQLRHVGVYVHDLETMSLFYQEVFHMFVLCEKLKQEDALIEDLLEQKYVKVTKLVTEYGKNAGSGDMLELLHYARENDKRLPFISDNCVFHVCFSVDDIESTVKNILLHSGKQCTEIHNMNNGNKCCFCQDPEGNWLELIEREV